MTGAALTAGPRPARMLWVTAAWGACFIVIRWGLRDAPVLWFAALRSLGAGGALLVLASLQGRPTPRGRPAWALIALLGVTNSSIAFAAMFAGVAGATVGRLAFIECGVPVIVPVNFALLDEDIVVRTGTGAKLRASAGDGLFSFEADAIDLSAETGWSVVVTGPAEELRRPDDIVRAEALGLRSWAREATGRFIRIRADTVEGRRLPSAV